MSSLSTNVVMFLKDLVSVGFWAFSVLNILFDEGFGSTPEYNCNTIFCSNPTNVTVSIYKSITDSQRLTISSKSRVLCSAQEACISRPLISSNESIHCEGERSCKNVANMTGQELECFGTDSCSLSTIDLASHGNRFVIHSSI